MDDSRKPSKWFYRSPMTNEEQGPFDLIELAGFLVSGDITSETLMRGEDSEQWQPFRNLPEFPQARTMPLGVITQHLDDEKAEEEDKNPFTIRHLYYFFWFLGGFVIYVLSLIIHSYFILLSGHRDDPNIWLIWLMRHLANHH